MAAFFTVAELQSRLGQNIEAVKAEQLADLASDVVRDEIRQKIDLVENDTITLYGDGGELLVLPELPVIAVTSVLLAGSAMTESVRWGTVGDLRRLSYTGSQNSGERVRRWPRGVAVTVVYTHGYATVPNTLKNVALELAAATYSKDDSMSNSGDGSTYRWQQMVLMTKVLGESNLRTALDRYRPVTDV